MFMTMQHTWTFGWRRYITTTTTKSRIFFSLFHSTHFASESKIYIQILLIHVYNSFDFTICLPLSSTQTHAQTTRCTYSAQRQWHLLLCVLVFFFFFSSIWNRLCFPSILFWLSVTHTLHTPRTLIKVLYFFFQSSVRYTQACMRSNTQTCLWRAYNERAPHHIVLGKFAFIQQTHIYIIVYKTTRKRTHGD